MALSPCTPALAVLLLVSLAGSVLCDDDCEAYTDSFGRWHSEQSCSFFSFCCGSCENRYCCMSPSNKLSESSQRLCIMTSTNVAFVAVGVTIFVVFTVTIILCFTCSCCCLYRMCRKPRPVVTATTATTVIHTPYPQQPGVPAAYPAAPYQGYQPIQPSPGYSGPMPAGMPTAPYPTPYPPPYAPQPSGPPGYQETMATGAGAPYPAAQPPYNPAYVVSPKPVY